MAASIHGVQIDTSKTYLFVKPRKIHYLREPQGFNEGMAFGNLRYQMKYSVEELERRLKQEGNPHVLQLTLEFRGDDNKHPSTWQLYADGYEIVSGNGDYAQECFEQSAEMFLDVCRLYIDSQNLPPLSEHDYRLLSRSRAIAKVGH